jgi:two-component system sensor histidine kinase UhpB
MAKRPPAHARLSRQMAEMQNRLTEAEDTLNAIRSGAVDALIVHTPRGEQLFTLKGADQTYRALVETMNEGALTLKRNIISYCNNHFSQMIGTPMENIFGASIFDFVESPDFSALLRRLHHGRAARGSLEAALRAADGSRVPVLLSASQFHSEGAALISLVVTDITERRRAEEALRQSEQRFQMVARTASDAIWDWNIKENRTWRSESFARIFGHPLKNLKPTFEWWRDRIHPDDRKEVLARVWATIHSRGNLHKATYRFRRGDGSYAQVADRAWVLRDPYHKATRMIGAMRDITEQMEAETARQELSRNIINAQEQERQRVARDLHDSVNQLLASAKYRLSSIGAHEGPEPDRASLEQVRELVERAIIEVRTISRNLRPSELDDLGLIAALRSLTHEFQKRTGIRSQFKCDSVACPKEMPKEVEMTLYRIAQEALNNVEKHSRAAQMGMTLNCARTHVLLAISDNGRGFKPRTTGGGKSGWGLENMTERAGLLGGNVEIASSKKGTKIAVRLPFGRARAKVKRIA